MGVLVDFATIRMVGLGAVIGSVLAVAGGCTTPDASTSRQAQAGPEPVPVPAQLSPDQEKDRADARQAYAACLRQAAQYMTAKGIPAGEEASLVAPLCYGQFTRYEDASTVAMSTRDKRAYDRAGDKRQVDLATDAIRQQGGLAALATASSK
ncbi:MAG TPA: hypothetical protein VH722_00850 [Alphaproteobacteria bacterium]|jgi:hypothetical protein|nr:hypothetical protein [Alphaproteobacteria bacterium]